MTDSSKAPIVNIDTILEDPDFTDTNPRRGDAFEAQLGFIGAKLGTRQIGINLTVVPPRSKAWPRHYHYINDEMFIVLSGAGTLHYGNQDYPVKAMDVIHIEAGTGIPFQIENDSDDNLRYLALSGMQTADLFHYTDSDKYGIMANGTPLRTFPSKGLDKFMRVIRADMAAEYWEGELKD
ncbi:MAG: cupin domain-containing protein [Pseudomonadota bacterium]